MTGTFLGGDAHEGRRRLLADDRFVSALWDRWDSTPGSWHRQVGRCRLGARFTDGPRTFHDAFLELADLAVRFRPKTVLEIGVNAGTSTCVWLWATEKVGGTVDSIDIPQRDPKGYYNADRFLDRVFLPPGAQTGWLVPDYLRTNARWRLHLRKSLDWLRATSYQPDTYDLIYQDGDHAYETVRTELTLLWPRLNPGGVLIMDDIDANRAYGEFARQERTVTMAVPTPHARGLLVKAGERRSP